MAIGKPDQIAREQGQIIGLQIAFVVALEERIVGLIPVAALGLQAGDGHRLDQVDHLRQALAEGFQGRPASLEDIGRRILLPAPGAVGGRRRDELLRFQRGKQGTDAAAPPFRQRAIDECRAQDIGHGAKIESHLIGRADRLLEGVGGERRRRLHGVRLQDVGKLVLKGVEPIGKGARLGLLGDGPGMGHDLGRGIRVVVDDIAIDGERGGGGGQTGVERRAGLADAGLGAQIGLGLLPKAAQGFLAPVPRQGPDFRLKAQNMLAQALAVDAARGGLVEHLGDNIGKRTQARLAVGNLDQHQRIIVAQLGQIVVAAEQGRAQAARRHVKKALAGHLPGQVKGR